MFIKQKYEDDFEHFILDMKDKYPKSIFELEGISDEDLDTTSFARKYFSKKNVADSSIDANANVQIKNVTTFKSEIHKGLDKLNSFHLLWKTARKHWGIREANRLCEKELNKDINIQDFHGFYLSYCFAFDCIDLVEQGLPFITNKPSGPARHADTLLRHAEQLIMYASRMMMGATAVSNILVIYSALLKKDLDNPECPVSVYKNSPLFEKYLEQEFQKFVYTINQPIRDAQSAFVNITLFDSIFLNELCKMYVVEGDFIDPEFAMYIQKQFMKAINKFNENDIFTFPVLTAQFKKTEEGEIEDQGFLDYVSEMNLLRGHINIFSATNLTALSSCCRLVNNVEDLIAATKEENMNLIGGSSIKVGSFGVTTVNLARIGFICKGDKEKFFQLLEEHARDCYKINFCRRYLIQEKIQQDQMPLYNFNFMKLENQYSTLGITGLYEAVHFMGYDMVKDTNGGRQFAIEVLQTLENIANEKMKKYGYRHNVEQIPAEQTASKLAKVDSILYKQNEFTLYGNQFIPLTVEADIYDRIELQALYEKYFSGGTILHANFGEPIPTKLIMKECIKQIVKAGVQYFAINFFFAKCKNNHIVHDHKDLEFCPICNAEIIERYTRIVGFLVPKSAFSQERREEYDERKKYPLDSTGKSFPLLNSENFQEATI